MHNIYEVVQYVYSTIQLAESRIGMKDTQITKIKGASRTKIDFKLVGNEYHLSNGVFHSIAVTKNVQRDNSTEK